jgi:hypothetical protein
MAAQKKGKRTINLILKDEGLNTISGQILSWALTYGRYIIIIIQIVVLSVFFLRFKLDRDHTDLKEAVTQKQALVQSVSDLETEIRRIQKILNDIRSTTTGQSIPLHILNFLEQNAPNDMKFSQLNILNDTVRFIASSDNLRSFNAFLRKLQQPIYFNDVILEDIQRKPDGRIEFRIQAKINRKGFG